MSEKKITFKIVTPEKIVYENMVDQATLPVLDGQVTILPGHCSYIAALKSGEISLKADGKDILMATSVGFIEFQHDTLMVLADTAEHAEEIDIARAQEARQRAEEDKVTILIEKETARINVAKKHHTRHGIRLD